MDPHTIHQDLTCLAKDLERTVGTTGWDHAKLPSNQSKRGGSGRLVFGDLFGGLENEFYDFPYIVLLFHSVGNFIIPTDELIFFRGVGIPPTSLLFRILKLW
jgi:hypothetical protein